MCAKFYNLLFEYKITTSSLFNAFNAPQIKCNNMHHHLMYLKNISKQKRKNIQTFSFLFDNRNLPICTFMFFTLKTHALILHSFIPIRSGVTIIRTRDAIHFFTATILHSGRHRPLITQFR